MTRSSTHPRRRSSAILSLLTLAAVPCGLLALHGARTFAQTPPPLLPAPLAGYVRDHVKLTPAQQEQLKAGAPVTKLMDADPSKEVAVFGAVWVKAPMARYVEAVRDIETFEKGENFRLTRKVSATPRLEDFNGLDLPDDDVADLKTCQVGKCQIKLSQKSIERVRSSIDFNKPDARQQVDKLAQQMAYEYVKGYVEGGNTRLAVYRDSDRPTFIATEFSSMVDRMPSLTVFLPQLKKYLVDYPNAPLPGSESFLYWQETRFGLKPTIRINHVVISQQPDHVAVASKMIYASHYFWTALELRVLVPDKARGDGFWFVSVNRSRSDGLSGFVGRLLRGKVRGEAEQGMAAVLKATKTMLERKSS